MSPQKLQTLVVLGRNPAISIAEIRARFPNSKICARDNAFAVFEDLSELDLKKIGGVVKAGEVLEHTLDFPIAKVSAWLSSELSAKSGKQTFAISLFPENTKTLQTLLVGAKKFLRGQKLSVRFANKDFQNLSSAQSEFEILKKNGTEILIANSGKNWWLAKLSAVQPFANYKFRDYEKKFRDARVGMLPPKLAQMLVNLATRDSKNLKVYDPFCGSGGVLAEAALLGHEIIGSDVDPRMLDFSKKNLAEFDFSADLFLHDARQKSSKKFDVIATEGYLGPPRRTLPDARMRDKIFSELEKLYTQFFGWLNCRRAVICFPVYLENGVPKFFASQIILPKISELGWKMQNAEKLIYSRKNQIVGREVVVLERPNPKG
ncbi:MAG: methyltransferase domain-containing protein [Candidatus Peribacteraceae bacterium]|nr:methyltransferase domain-containing protein [Candidatus Peribacteraceae bacterium]